MKIFLASVFVTALILSASAETTRLSKSAAPVEATEIVKIAEQTVADEASEVIRLSEPVAADDASETFGSLIEDSLEVKTLSQVLASSSEYLDREFAIEVGVKKVCQKKGCFFVAQEGAATIRVAFKDYGFFVPTDIANKKVILVGTLKKRELSVEDAEHFSKDLGEEGSIKAGLMHEIVASAVKIPKA